MALAATAAPLAAQELVLVLNPAQARIRFTLAATLHTVHGSFRLKSGMIRYDPVTGRIGGEVVADATSGESGEPSRDRRMHKTVLESARYPDIVFAPDRVEGTVAAEGISQVQVHGVFRIHGSAHQIVIPVEVTRNGAATTVKTQFVIPYVKWGMKNPSTLFLRVGNQVEIDASAAAP